MRREPERLADENLDVLVIGAGINGACIAWDAALRGLSVAVIDRGDFVSSTSANSLKIIHGGLRYLQTGDLRRMRRSVRERSFWLRTAPHLVHPLPCTTATRGRGLRSRTAFRAALAVNDMVGFDRNRELPDSHRIPAGRVVGCREMLDSYAGWDADRITGGIIWHDAQTYHSERLVINVLQDASRTGAVVANYVEASKLLYDDRRVSGAELRDTLTGQVFEARAAITVNAAGPGAGDLLRPIAPNRAAEVRLCKAINILSRPIAGATAVGVPVRGSASAAGAGSRLLFVTPWRGMSLIGTAYYPHDGGGCEASVSERHVSLLVGDINRTLPNARLTPDDVGLVHVGLLPIDPGASAGHAVEDRLLRHDRVIDHAKHDGITGLISLIGIKYTTGRLAAENVVDRVCTYLDRRRPRCSTLRTGLTAGRTGPLAEFEARIHEQFPGLPADFEIEHAVRLYGADLPAVLAGCGEREAGHTAENVGASRWKAAQVRYAVRNEAAVCASDVVFRRTDFAARGAPSPEDVRCVVEVMANELGWDDQRRRDEYDSVIGGMNPWRASRAQ